MLQRYSIFPFANANGQIPQLNIWDDHDVSRCPILPAAYIPRYERWTLTGCDASTQIIDGFGSYTNDFMKCDVFRGIGGTAHKYYLLFQHHLPPPASTYTSGKPTHAPGPKARTALTW